jgi:voltage-dependent calcium channel R type alpha-1E
MKIKLLSTKPYIKKKVESSNKLRKFCSKIMKIKYFDYFIFTCIILNTVSLTIHWYQIPDNISSAMKIVNYSFAAIFALEAIIKLIALGLEYFKDSWNIFDFIIVLATTISIILDFFTTFVAGGKATIIRTFRVARIFRIV